MTPEPAAQEKKTPDRNKNHISPDGKWETMGRPPGLLRYVQSGTFFGRTRYKGKLILKSLETSDYAVARDRLPVHVERWKVEFDQADSEKTKAKESPTIWNEASAQYLAQVETRARLGEIKWSGAAFIDVKVRRLEFFWPSLTTMAVKDLRCEDFQTFLAEAKEGINRCAPLPKKSGRTMTGDFKGGPQSALSCNHMLSAARGIVAAARKMDKRKGLQDFACPLEDIKWMQVTTKIPTMPTDAEWAAIADGIGHKDRKSTGPAARRRELLARFLSVTGARPIEVLGFSQRQMKKDRLHPGFRFQDMKFGYTVLKSAKKKGAKFLKQRDVPWIAGAKELMEAIRKELFTGDETALVFAGIGVDGLRQSLACAIRRGGFTHLKGFSQYKIRHLFATKCVEVGVPWRILADWLGHEDGGILAAKTYSHVRKESSTEWAGRVSFKL